MTPDTPASEPLPVVAYRQFSDFGGWHTYPNAFVADGQHMQNDELVCEAAAQAIIARLTSERDAALLALKVSEGVGSNAFQNAQELLQENIRIKATRPDPDAVMRLADEYADKEYLASRFGGHFSNERDAARAALLAKVRGEA